MIKIILIMIGILFLGIMLLCVFGGIVFIRMEKQRAEEILLKGKKGKSKVVTEKDIEKLPELVKRYLRYTQMIGKERITTVKLKQKGFFRSKENQKWLPITATQYFNIDFTEFLWIAKIKIFPLISIYAKDEFINGKGNLAVKMLGLIRVVNAEGREIDQGEILRFLAECIWFPSAFLNKNIKWDIINNTSVKATISYKDISASAIFHFGKKGEIISVTAKRYREVDGKFVLEDWEGRILEYKEFNGILIPNKVDIVWKLKTGNFCYDRVEIVDIEYNKFSSY